LAREVAEIAVKEYLEGDFVAQLQDAEGAIKLAEAELSLAEVELNVTKDLVAKTSGSQLPIKRAEVTVLRARLALEKAQSRKDVLARYTRPKRQRELESAVKKANTDELARQATWEPMKAKEAKLEQQIAACRVVAPIDGMIGTSPNVGSTVRPGLLLFTIAPLDQPGGSKSGAAVPGR
jgi:multidrug resistance efflux pump